MLQFSGFHDCSPPVYWIVKNLNYQQHPQKAYLCVKGRHMTYISSKLVHRCDLQCAWRGDQKDKGRKKPYMANWLFAQTTHVIIFLKFILSKQLCPLHRSTVWRGGCSSSTIVISFIEIGWAVTELRGVEIWLIWLLMHMQQRIHVYSGAGVNTETWRHWAWWKTPIGLHTITYNMDRAWMKEGSMQHACMYIRTTGVVFTYTVEKACVIMANIRKWFSTVSVTHTLPTT